MKPNTKIKILGWGIIITGSANALLPDGTVQAFIKSMLIGMIWIMAGIGILLKSNIARIIVMVFSVVGVCMATVGLIGTSLAIIIPFKKGIPQGVGLQQVVFYTITTSILCIVSGFVSFYIYNLLKRNEIKTEFIKKKGRQNIDAAQP